MNLPFTADQFFDVFRRYNESVWPAQLALHAIALAAAGMAYRANVRRSGRSAQAAIVLLAALWLWTGIVYFKMFFASITPAGEIFGSLFIAEAGLLLLSTWGAAGSFVPATRSSAVLASMVIAYALLVYPLLGVALGHRYPDAPTFGAPCPEVIFTFGVFCLLPSSIPRFAIAIPVLWLIVGSYAAFGFGMREDLGLIVAAIAAMVVIHHATHRATRTCRRMPRHAGM